MNDVMPWVVSNLIFPLYHWARRDGLLQAVKRLKASQWKSPDELRALQAEKLFRLLRHCEKNVPYYSRLFRRMGCTADDLTDYDTFRKLPFLTKSIIKDSVEQLRAIDDCAHRLKRNSTSGSTGEPLVFFNDRKSLIERQAVVLRNQSWVGALYSDREARLWGAQMDIDKVASWKGRIHGMIHNTIYLSSYNLSDDSMRKYSEILSRFKPKLLISYPSPLTTFSQFLLENGISIPSIQSIITSAEKLFDWQREQIEKAFTAPIFDRYGCREFGNIAHECEAHEGYHVNCERVFLEVLDDRGQPVENGQPGKIYLTDLDNMGFPFIRYEIGDVAVPSHGKCSCGRGLPLLKKIEGRSFDIVRCPNGNRVAGTFWTICLRRYKGVVRFQVIQEAIDSLVIKLVTDDELQADTEPAMSAEIRKKCGDEMRIRYEYVDHIELTNSGKERLVISRLMDG